MNTNHMTPVRKILFNQRAIILSSLILLFGVPIANCTEIIDAQLDTDLVEKHEPEVKVSGNVIVGVMSATANHGLMKNLLAVQPAGDGETLCLKVTSRDGIYTSTNKYSMGSSSDAIIRLPYESNFQNVINTYSKNKGDVAITTAVGTCDQTAMGDYYLPATLDRRNQTLKVGDISIYINGFDATDVAYQIESSNDSLPIQDCRYIEEGRHTAYNFACDLSLKDIVKVDDSITIKIFREVYGRELKSVSIRILAVN